MTVEEKIVNGKIVENRVGYVFKLIERYMDSLVGNKLNLDHYLDFFERNSKRKDQFNPDDLLKIQINIKALIGSHRKLFIQDAIDLYEFFYLEWKPGGKGYNYNNFLLDEKDFKKKRFSKKQIEKLMKNPLNNIDELVKSMEKNEKLLKSYFEEKNEMDN